MTRRKRNMQTLGRQLQKLRKALEDAGYRYADSHPISSASGIHLMTAELYTRNESPWLLLTIAEPRGPVYLYTPVTTSHDMDDIIAAIPRCQETPA